MNKQMSQLIEDFNNEKEKAKELKIAAKNSQYQQLQKVVELGEFLIEKQQEVGDIEFFKFTKKELHISKTMTMKYIFVFDYVDTHKSIDFSQKTISQVYRMFRIEKGEIQPKEAKVKEITLLRGEVEKMKLMVEQLINSQVLPKNIPLENSSIVKTQSIENNIIPEPKKEKVKYKVYTSREELDNDPDEIERRKQAIIDNADLFAYRDQIIRERIEKGIENEPCESFREILLEEKDRVMAGIPQTEFNFFRNVKRGD
jgi:hypothetical protein